METVTLDHYRLDLVRRGSGTLVVTFEPMTASMHGASPDRPGWGAHFLNGRSEDNLFVKTSAPHWYRRPDFHRWLDGNAVLFGQYDRVVLMGGSMGGYGALAFARVMRATEVFALNPQSSLAADLTPWETRFAHGRREDWSGPYRDAAEELHGTLYVIADRYDVLDRRHVARLGYRGYANFPFVGHKIPAWLSQLNGLKVISAAIIDGLPEAEIRRLIVQRIRRRRQLERWWAGLHARAAARGKAHRLTPFLTPDRLAGTIRLQPEDAQLRQEAALLYRAVARGSGLAPEAARDWNARASEIETGA